MNNSECIDFLQWCLPLLQMRWAGFRKVRKQVCKRIGRRIDELKLTGLPAYRTYLGDHPDEWRVLDSLCRVTISRFYRDCGVFDHLRDEILPGLASAATAAGIDEIRCWSTGCASGEEAYTIKLLWEAMQDKEVPAPPRIHITATDSDSLLLERAKKGRYTASALKDLPGELVESCFDASGREFVIRDSLRDNIDFIEQDIRASMPDGCFNLILCRNLVFTYFEESLQEEIIKKIQSRLVRGGYLVIGIHEHIPPGQREAFLPSHAPCIYRKQN